MGNHYDGVKGLRPFLVLDDEDNPLDWYGHVEPRLIAMIRLVTIACENAWNGDSERYMNGLSVYKAFTGSYPSTFSMRKFLYDNGLGVPVLTTDGSELPSNCNASRLKEIATRDMGRTITGFLASDNPLKRFGGFSKDIDLSYTDNQLSQLAMHDSLTYNGHVYHNVAVLRLNVLGERVRLFTIIPTGLLNRAKTVKVCKPVIRLDRHGSVILNYKVCYDTPKYGKARNATVRAGIDLGLVEPYTLVITNNNGRVMERYTASRELKTILARVNHLYEEAHKLEEKLESKQEQWSRVGIPVNVQNEWSHGLYREIRRRKYCASRLKRFYAERMSAEVRRRITSSRTSVTFVNMEELGWLAGAPGRAATCTTKWNYGECRSRIIHSLDRDGVWVGAVNAAGTSQHCNQCGAMVVHDTVTRRARCPNGCLTMNGWDRDLNAAVNIANRNGKPA